MLGWLLGLRDSGTQVALLDRIAGTGAQAQRFGGALRRLREAEAQLEALEALGDEDARHELQAFADEVPSSAHSAPAPRRSQRNHLRAITAERIFSAIVKRRAEC